MKAFLWGGKGGKGVGFDNRFLFIYYLTLTVIIILTCLMKISILRVREIPKRLINSLIMLV